METTELITCPYCGQSFQMLLDTTISRQRFETDCEICCRPFTVAAECEGGALVMLQTEPG